MSSPELHSNSSNGFSFEKRTLIDKSPTSKAIVSGTPLSDKWGCTLWFPCAPQSLFSTDRWGRMFFLPIIQYITCTIFFRSPLPHWVSNVFLYFPTNHMWSKGRGYLGLSSKQTLFMLSPLFNVISLGDFLNDAYPAHLRLHGKLLRSFIYLSSPSSSEEYFPLRLACPHASATSDTRHV